MSLSLLTGAFACLVAAAVLGSRHRDRLRADVVRARGQRLRTLFSNPARLGGRPIRELERELGLWQERDDWDLGRFHYLWVEKDLTVRVCTQSDIVVGIDFLERLGGPSAEVVETRVWEQGAEDAHGTAQ